MHLIETGQHETLAPSERAFVYMCLEHSESTEVVTQAVALFAGLCSADSHKFFKNQLRVARNHLSTLEKFERYPHRNELLGRSSTQAEHQHVKASQRRFVHSVKVHRTVAPLRILVLHSFRQSGARLQSRASKMVQGLAPFAKLVFADAPLSYQATGTFRTELEEDFGDQIPEFAHQRCWWNSNVDHSDYDGWHISLVHLNQVFQTQGPFDGVLGFAQGAAVVGILAGLQARGKLGEQAPAIQFDFAMSISGYCSRAQAHTSLFAPQSIALPSFHCWAEGDVLITNERSQALADSFANAEIHSHESGHFVPGQWPIEEMAAFLRSQAKPIAHDSPWSQRISASCMLRTPMGLSKRATNWATIDWSNPDEWLTQTGGSR